MTKDNKDEQLNVKGPKGNEINLSSTFTTLKSFSDDTIAAAIQDIIFSLDLSRKDDYASFVKELTTLLVESGVRTRLEQSLIAQVKILQRRKPKSVEDNRDISEVFTVDQGALDGLSSDLKLQLDITNYILNYFKEGNFQVVEQCLDVLLKKNVLINTVKNFIKKEIQYYINNQDSENIKRIANKYIVHPKLAPAIKEQLDRNLNA